MQGTTARPGGGDGLTFSILGPLEVHRHEQPLTVTGTRWRPLLAALLLRPNQVVSDDRLLEDVWGEEPPPGAATTLRASMSRLRSSLEPARARGDSAVLPRRGPGYVLVIAPEHVDCHRFEMWADDGARLLAAGDPAAAADRLAAALSLWRGPALVDVADRPFARPEASRLEERRLAALEDRIAAEMALGRHAELTSDLEALVAGHPLRERLRELQLLALYRCGRQVEALRAYQAARRVLNEEIGLDPGPALRRMEEAILRQDAELDWVAPRPAGSASTSSMPAHGLAGAPEPSDERVFVGRQRELGVLAEMLQRASAGRGGVAVLIGEAGVGKTATVEAALAQTDTTWRVLGGRAYEGGGAPSFWPWVQALRGCFETIDPTTLGTLLGPAAPVLAQIVPELGEYLPGLTPPPAMEPDAARFRLFDAVATCLKRLAADRPTAVFIDDLHWADPPSLLLLEFIAREVERSPLALLATSRASIVNSPIGDTVAELARLASVRRIDVGGLGEDDVAALLAAHVDEATARRLTEAVWRKTDGNAFFVTEVIRLLAEDDSLDASTLVPPNVRAVVERRIGQLSPWGRRLLEVAAVAGRHVDLGIVGSVAGLHGEDRLIAIDEVINDGLLRGSQGVGMSGLRFAHDLVRDAVLDVVPGPQRVASHLAIGEALEEAQLAGRPCPADRLAHHFLEAAPGGEHAVTKAVRYSRLAADAASRALAYEDAAAVCERALAVLDLAAGSHLAERADLLVRLGESQARVGDTTSARRSFEAAATLAARLDDATLLARAALGVGTIGVTTGMVDRGLVSLIEGALAALPPQDSALRARLTTRLAMELYYSGSPERSASLSGRAVEMARRVGEPATLAETLSGWHFCLRSPSSLDARLAVGSELLVLAGSDPELTLRARHERVTDLFELGTIEAVDEELGHYVALAEELRQPRYLWQAASWRAMRALLGGRFDIAESLIDEAFALGEPIQPETALQYYAVQLATLRREQDRLEEIVESVAGFVQLFPNAPAWRCAELYMLAELGRLDEATPILERLGADDFSEIPRDVNWLPAMSLLSLSVIAIGDRAKADQIVELLEPFEGRNVVVGGVAATSCYGPAAYNVGALLAFLDRPDDALAKFDIAVRLAEAMGAGAGWLTPCMTGRRWHWCRTTRPSELPASSTGTPRPRSPVSVTCPCFAVT